MKRRPSLCALAIISALVISACDFIFDDGEDEPISANMQYYVGDELIQQLKIPPNTPAEATINCDRFVEFGLSEYAGVTKMQMVREIDGVETSCDMLTDAGDFLSQLQDWPARSTTYRLLYDGEGGPLEFGPFTVTVEAVGEVVSGHDVHLGDQGYDGSGYGCFFQTRHVGWGGGNTNPNWPSFMAQYVPRLIDFATVTEGDQLMAISPSRIQEMSHTFDLLVNDCGYTTTTFAAYSGALDPQIVTPSLAEIEALPDPPDSATEINLSEGLLFVYKTAEGKKGLVKVKDLVEEAAGTHFDLDFATAK